MINDSKLLLLLFCILFFILNACNQELEFEKLEQESYNREKLIHDVYLVHHWRDNAPNEKIIDDFSCELMNKNLLDIKHLTITFYKATRKTNVKYLKAHPDHMTQALLNDYLWHYNYHFQRGDKIFSKMKVKNVKGRKFFFPEVQCTF